MLSSALLILLVSCAKPDEPKDADDWVALGKVEVERFLNARERASSWTDVPEEALAYFERAASLEPEHRAAQLGIASIYDLKGDIALATEVYQRLLIQNPDDAKLQKLVGSGLLSQARYDEAITVLEGAAKRLQADPTLTCEHLSTLELLGRAYAGTGRYRESESVLIEAASTLESLRAAGQTEFAARPYTALGQLYRKTGDDKRAVEMFVQAADQDPERARVQHDAALYLFYRGEPDRALPYVDRAIALRDLEDDHALRTSIETALSDTKARIPADGAFDAAMRATDRYDFVTAEELVDQALTVASDPRFLALKGWLLLRASRLDQAEVLFNRLGPPAAETEAAVFLAHLDLAREDFASAERRLKSVETRIAGLTVQSHLPSVAAHAGWPWLLFKRARLGMGHSEAGQGRHAEAIEYFDRVLRIQPRDREALAGKARSRAGIKRVVSEDSLAEPKP
jgi:tetratricopeptide (TPR) repeat protein